MAKITLDNVVGGYDLTKINANFQKIQDELNNKVLYRNNPVGEPNQVITDLDINGKTLINAGITIAPNGFLFRGPWQSLTAYVLNNLVSINGNTYIAVANHLSSGSFATDLGLGYWSLFAAAGTSVGSLQIAQNLADLANAATARTNLGVPANFETYRHNNFRLSLLSNVSIPTSDVIGAGTLYFTPHNGNLISLYDGTRWVTRQTGQISIPLTGLTTGLCYDVFVYDNAGTPALELTAWTTATARAIPLTTFEGTLIRTSAITRRYVGTIRATGSTTAEDSRSNRYVWNYYNRVSRSLRRFEPTANWNYTSTTIRVANGNAANVCNFVVGLPEDSIDAELITFSTNGTGVNNQATIGLNSTTGAHADCLGGIGVLWNAGVYQQHISVLKTLPAAGFNYISWLESGAATGTTTWFGGGTYGTGQNLNFGLAMSYFA